MAVYRYKVFDPSGNVTALVMGLEQDAAKRRAVCDAVLAARGDIEQVGFVSEGGEAPTLCMAGGEFCGNATRSAVWHFLNGQPGEMTIRVMVDENTRELGAGVTASHEVWAHVPVQDRPGNVWHVGDGLYFVEMEGIAHLVVAQRQAEVYLQGLDMAESEHRALLKTYGRKLLQKHKLLTRKAVGVMFCESVLDLVKIHPCVFINTVGTEYYEMACGSGSLAVAMVSTTMRGGSGGLPVLQPSGKVITAVVEYRAGVVSGAAISGGMCAEAEVLEIEVL